MIDTTVFLSFCYALVVRANLMWWEALFRLRTAFGLKAFGLEAFGCVFNKNRISLKLKTSLSSIAVFHGINVIFIVSMQCF